MFKRIVMVATLVAAMVANADKKVWLEEIDRSDMVCSYRKPYEGRSIDGGLLTLGGKVYEKGLGAHAYSLLQVPVGGNALSFEATVGIDDEMKDRRQSSVVFNIYGDGKLLATSGLLKRKKRTADLKVDLRGVNVVGLEITDGGDSNDSDHADWANAFFMFKDGTGPVNAASLTRQLGILTPPTAATPRINGATVFGVRPHSPIIWRLAVTGEKPIKILVDGLPSGAYFDESIPAVLGAVVRKGEYPLTITAKNAKGEVTKEVKLVVGDKIALTPPMGWNSWNAFHGQVTDKKIRAAADVMVSSGLADHGWNYINIDDYWQYRPEEKTRKELIGKARNEDGTVRSNMNFPNMKELCCYIHSKGLRAGIYSSPGPLTCGGCEGSWQHEFRDAKTYADWGFDYLKYDWCSYNRVAVGMSLDKARYPYFLMGKALREQNRDIVFSLCQYGMNNVSSWGEQVYGSCWRTTGDVFDTWGSIYSAITAQAKLWYWSKPGAWNDPDMLCVGKMIFNKYKGSRLTPNQQYTHISLWALVASPLMIGCDMTQLDEFTLNLLTNDEVIDINQDPLGAGAAKVSTHNRAEVWVRPLADGSIAVGLLNAALFEQEVTLDMKALGLDGKWRVRDVWRQKDEGVFEGTYKYNVYGHATHLIRLYPTAGASLNPRVIDVRDAAWMNELKGLRKVDEYQGDEEKEEPCEPCKFRRNR